MISFKMESSLCFSQNLGFRTINLDATIRPSLSPKRGSFDPHLRHRASNRVLALASNSAISTESYSSSTQKESGIYVNPVYVPTPPNRELRTPHSGKELVWTFPIKWFWVQCNVFEGATGEVALTAAGGLRQLPGLDSLENAALIGIHYDGIFYEFVPWNSVVNWEIAPWGCWYIAAENETHMVELKATTNDPGTTLRAPTSEAGLAPACKDTCFGELTLQMWEQRFDGTKGKMILDVTSDMAALEVGGGPSFNTWKGKTTMPELLQHALNVPVDMDGLFGLVPLFKPPGL